MKGLDIIMDDTKFREHYVDIRWDAEARTWYAVCDSIPLALESESFDALIERVRIVAPEILEENNAGSGSCHLCFRAERWEYIA